VVAICPQCRALNTGQAGRCALCGAPFDTASPVRAIASASSLPPWRLEVAQRVEAYRARREHPGTPGGQSRLPFRPPQEGLPARPSRPLARAVARPAPRPVRPERVAITLRQRELDFSPTDRPDTDKARVADLGTRFRAGLWDALFLLGAYGAFLACFWLLGGQLIFEKFDFAIYLAALVLLYGQYFALFTILGRVTPGMRLCQLELLAFDGKAPGPRQMLSRSFGYFIAGGAGFLGFLWSLWDEDHLTWQDRISQTYLSPAPALEPGLAEEPPTQTTAEDERPARGWRRMALFLTASSDRR
jgi:uncharacterized RDD family membrane protein YckC